MFVQDLAERLAHISVRLKEKQVPCPLNRCKAHGLNPSRPAVVKGTPRGASSQSRPAAWRWAEDKQPGRLATSARSVCPPAGRPGAPTSNMSRAPTMGQALLRLFKVVLCNPRNPYGRQTLTVTPISQIK